MTKKCDYRIKGNAAIPLSPHAGKAPEGYIYYWQYVNRHGDVIRPMTRYNTLDAAAEAGTRMCEAFFGHRNFSVGWEEW